MDVIEAGRRARRLARQSDLARELATTSRQVWAWNSRSNVNGFPAPVASNIGPVRAGGRRHHLLWDLDEVLAWFSTYDESKQRARGGSTQKGRKWSYALNRWLEKEEQ